MKSMFTASSSSYSVVLRDNRLSKLVKINIIAFNLFVAYPCFSQQSIHLLVRSLNGCYFLAALSISSISTNVLMGFLVGVDIMADILLLRLRIMGDIIPFCLSSLISTRFLSSYLSSTISPSLLPLIFISQLSANKNGLTFMTCSPYAGISLLPLLFFLIELLDYSKSSRLFTSFSYLSFL